MKFLLIPLMAFLSRLDGGGWPRSILERYKLDAIPCILFGIGIALPFYRLPWLALAVIVYSFFAKNTGHGSALNWGDDLPAGTRNRKEFLTPFVDGLAKLFHIPLHNSDGVSSTLSYCRLFMAAKGFFIGLPLFPLGLSMVILQPLSYEIGHRLKNSVISELLTGASVGLILGGIL